MELLFPALCAVEGQDRTGDAGEGSSTVSRSQTHSCGKKMKVSDDDRRFPEGFVAPRHHG